MATITEPREPVLVVLEAPGKIAWFEREFKKIGVQARIVATKGHLFTLPFEASVPLEALETWVPIQGQKGRIKYIQALSGYQSVVFATDDDLDGELIAAHVSSLLSESAQKFRLRLTSLDAESFANAFAQIDEWTPRVRSTVLLRYFDILSSAYLSDFSSGLPVGRVLSRAVNAGMGGNEGDPENSLSGNSTASIPPKPGDRFSRAELEPSASRGFLTIGSLINGLCGYMSCSVRDAYGLGQVLYEKGFCTYIRTVEERPAKGQSGNLARLAALHGYHIDKYELAGTFGEPEQSPHGPILPTTLPDAEQLLSGQEKQALEYIQKASVGASLARVYSIDRSHSDHGQSTMFYDGAWMPVDSVFGIPGGREEGQKAQQTNQRSLLNFLLERRLCAPGQLVNHSEKLLRYFSDGRQANSAGCRVARHAQRVCPGLLAEDSYSKAMNLLESSMEKPMDALFGALELIGGSRALTRQSSIDIGLNNSAELGGTVPSI